MFQKDTDSMFDFSFPELMVVGAVALVILGPERLPTIARTAGQWLGKAQRMVQQVKNDIEREAELSELKQLKNQAEDLANDLKKTVQAQTDGVTADLKKLESDVNTTANELTAGFDSGAGKLSQQSTLKPDGVGVDDIATPEGVKSVDVTDLSSNNNWDKKPSSVTAESLSVPDVDTSVVADNVNNFYDWYGPEEPIGSEDNQSQVKTTFERRYKAGPSVNELAEQIEQLKRELGDRSPQAGSHRRRLAVRSRVNRARIYR